MATTLTITAENTRTLARPNENFNVEFSTAAGAPGAPKRADDYDVIGKSVNLNIMDRVETDVLSLQKKNGLVCVQGFGVTNARILAAAACVDALVLAQKNTVSKAVLESYINLRCARSRSDLPGNIIGHLTRRDGQDDCGRPDGFRWGGSWYNSVVSPQGTMRAYMHVKRVLGFVEGKTPSSLIPAFSYEGSANITHGAEGSFETMIRSTDAKTILRQFDDFAFFWSLSEGLYNFSQGIIPTYTWEPNPVVYTTAPVCPDCGKPMYVAWVEPEKKSGKTPERKLLCISCTRSVDFLKEFQPVVR